MGIERNFGGVDYKFIKSVNEKDEPVANNEEHSRSHMSLASINNLHDDLEYAINSHTDELDSQLSSKIDLYELYSHQQAASAHKLVHVQATDRSVTFSSSHILKRLFLNEMADNIL